MRSLTGDAFRASVLESDRPVLVLFKKPGCNACTVASRHLSAVEEKYGEEVQVFTLDTTMFPEAKKGYVQDALPVTVLFHEGVEVWRRIGASVTPEKVALFLDDLL